MASIAINLLLGRSLAEHSGVRDDSDKNLVGITLAGLGLTPMGIVLARQIAQSRAAPPEPPKRDDDRKDPFNETLQLPEERAAGLLTSAAVGTAAGKEASQAAGKRAPADKPAGP